MSRKQTLKQLLGTSDERQEVTLDLRPTQLTPTVRGGGSYGIAAPPIAKETQFSQLASALGKINPILKDYQETKLTKEKTNLIQAESQILDIQEKWEGMSDEERKEFLDQQIEGRDAAEAAINKEFRGKYELNPIALVRAQKIIGASYVDELTRDEAVDFNEAVKNRDPLEGQIDAEFVGDFLDQRDEEFVDKNPWLTESPLAMDGFNARLRDTRIRNQKQFLADGQKYYKENVLYPHISKNLTSIMTLPASNAEQGVSINQNIDEIWKVTDGLSFAETSKMLTDWVGSVSMQDAERVSYYLSKIGKLKIGNTTVANTPEVYNVIEETLYQRQEEFDKRIETQETEEAEEASKPFIVDMSTINSVEVVDGTDRYTMIEERNQAELDATVDRYEKGEITFDQFQTQLAAIDQATNSAKIQIANALSNVEETAGITQGHFDDSLINNVADIQEELNLKAEGGFSYTFYESVYNEASGRTENILRDDIKRDLEEIAVEFELKRQAALLNSANLITKKERVAEYRQSVQDLDTAFKARVSQYLQNRSKLSGQTPLDHDVVSAQNNLLAIEETPTTRNIPLFGRNPEISKRGSGFNSTPSESFADSHAYIYKELKIDEAGLLEGTAGEEATGNYLTLKPQYSAVREELVSQFNEMDDSVTKRFSGGGRAGTSPRILIPEHKVYAGTLPAVGMTMEDINNLDFVQQYGEQKSYYRNPKGYRITATEFVSQMKDGLIPITDYMEMSEESRQALAERFGADFEVFDRRQKMLNNLRGQ